jgi:membrane protein DedA with SNARE-associated domain
MHDLIAALTAWVTSVVQAGGYLGVAGLTFLETLFPPIPSEVVLPIAGFLVSEGSLAFVWVVAAATAGSVVGALVLYALGRKLGEEGLRRFVRDRGKWVLLSEDDVKKAGGWFKKHGGKAVLIGRLVPTVRSIISIPAGVEKMPLLPFVLYTTAGSAVWSAALVGAGALLGSQWEQIKPFLQVLEWGALLAIAAGMAWLVWRRKKHGDAPAEG